MGHEKAFMNIEFVTRRRGIFGVAEMEIFQGLKSWKY